MKKLTLIAISFVLFFAACKRDKDFRDRYVGEYEGTATNNTFSYPHNSLSIDPVTELHLSKHPDIDNAMVVDYAHMTWPNNGGNLTYDKEFHYHIVQNIIYLSDQGFLYLKNTNEYNLHKNCDFIEPDSLFSVVHMLYNTDNQYYIEDYFFRLKKK